eukprot:gene7711-13538_t
MVSSNSTLFHGSLITISTITFLINAVTIAMFLRFRKQLLEKNPHYRVLCSLCFADALVGCFGVSLGAHLVTKSSRAVYKLAGNIPLFCCMFASIGSLSLLTANRLLALKRPHSYGSASYLRRSSKFIAAIWICPFFIYIQQVVIFLSTRSKTELRTRGIISLVFFAAAAACLIVANFVLCLGIRNRINKARLEDSRKENKITHEPGPGKPCSEENGAEVSSQQSLDESSHDNVECSAVESKGHRQRKGGSKGEVQRSHKLKQRRQGIQVSIVCVTIVALFLILWTPLIVYRMLYTSNVGLSNELLRRLFLCLAISNSFLNPLIYLWKDTRLRKYFKKMTCIH